MFAFDPGDIIQLAGNGVFTFESFHKGSGLMDINGIKADDYIIVLDKNGKQCWARPEWNWTLVSKASERQTMEGEQEYNDIIAAQAAYEEIAR